MENKRDCTSTGMRHNVASMYVRNEGRDGGIAGQYSRCKKRGALRNASLERPRTNTRVAFNGGSRVSKK